MFLLAKIYCYSKTSLIFLSQDSRAGGQPVKKLVGAVVVGKVLMLKYYFLLGGSARYCGAGSGGISSGWVLALVPTLRS